METEDFGLRNVEANKTFTMGGVEYKPGDRVDVSKLRDHKISQMLRQRMLRPGRPELSETTR